MDLPGLQRLTLAVGLASARGSDEDVAELVQGLDGDTATALLAALSKSWVNALELFLAAEGHPDPKTAVVDLLQAEAFDVATE
ncbi:secretion protein HlyD [Streptomyces tendae]|uniref:secretion protein HlyD n=1 Tax=Streptomyces tendae TaxID=1932 RepID=UPI0036FF8BAF